MRYDFKGVQVPEETIQQLAGRLATYRHTLGEVVLHKNYDVPEAALASIVDQETIARADEVAEALGPVRHVVLVGIGGSSVGTEAVYRVLETEHSPALYVLDIIDSEHVAAIASTLAHVPTAEIALVVVSKSGSTTETLANADALIGQLKRVHGAQIHTRVVCVGDAGTKLHGFARERGIRFVSMPEKVGGRFSVFTAVGLVPLRLLDISIDSFLSGAVSALMRMASAEEVGEDRVVRSASAFVARAEMGDRVNVLFAEHERLVGCVKWYEQLLAESLGKEVREDGQAHVHGMVPVPMTSRELHSTAQLFLSGFKGVYTTFIGIDRVASPLTLTTTEFGGLLSLGASRVYDRIPEAIAEGVHRAYKGRNLSHALITLKEITAEEIGGFMAERMLEVMYIAHLWNIHAFDQPHVELYKKETRDILHNQQPEKGPASVYVLFDIGGTKTRVALSTDLATIEATAKFPTPATYAEGVAHIVAEAQKLLAGRAVGAVAGDVRGILNPDKTRILHDTVLTDWVEKPLAAGLGRAFGAPVHLENDTALVGLGEAHFGAGKGYDIVAYHTVSTGVGGARIVDGHVDVSHVGFEPGKQVIDIDHTVHPDLQSGGTLEELISGEALEKRTGKKPYETPQSDIALWDELAGYLAYGLKNTIMYWSPDVIVLGGSMVVGDPRILLADVERHTKALLGDLPCPPIVDATLKDEGGLYGAMALLRQ